MTSRQPAFAVGCGGQEMPLPQEQNLLADEPPPQAACNANLEENEWHQPLTAKADQ